MNLSSFVSFARRALFAISSTLLLGALFPAQAQVVSSGITGVVTTDDGNPVSGATVTAVHVPTNASYTATTGATGRYNFRSLIVGGPWEITASSDGYSPAQRSGITTTLGSDIDVSFSLAGSDVVTMEALEVTADSNVLDGNALGAGGVLTSERLAAQPTSERSLADMAKANAMITLRETFGDREESQLTALGQNNRFNSFLIDGARINDQFGLNGTGLASFFNPISLDAVEQLSVQLSPYDVRYAGFTGAAINIVTKSGTNEYKGSVSYVFRGDELFGLQMQGPDYRTLVNNNRKEVPKLERETWVFTFGGPIIKDKLFFFLNYEDFQSANSGRDPNFATPLEGQLLSRLEQYASASGADIDWGSPVTGTTSNVSSDEKIIAKVDWNVNEDHRASFRYSKTEGSVPQFGRFGSTSFNFFGPTATLRGGVVTTPDGAFYQQDRVEESYSAQLFSQWTPDFKTEIKYSQTTQDQLTPLNSTAPEVYIYGVSGTDLRNGSATNNGVYIAGTEQFRHGNVINVESKNLSATGDYFFGDWTFSGGFEREQTDFYNLFRQGSYGLVGFPTVADFLADTNAQILRNAYDPNVRNVADISDFATNGIFGQATWNPTSRLTLVAGLRYEFQETDIRPELNQAFLSTTGFRNDGTVDGSSSISPRLGFNLALDEDRTWQLRGGVGHFLGRAPWVIFSNSFGQTGVGSFTLQNRGNGATLPQSFTDYLRTFDPANPVGTGTDNPALVREVNWVDDGISMPSVWRGNLALEKRINFLDSIITAEVIHTEVDEALFIVEENLVATTLGADGRQRFKGSPTSRNTNRFGDYRNLLRVTNTGVGKSTYASIAWDRPMKDNWGFGLSYTRGEATDAQAIGQTTAGGQWNRNVIFNQNTPEEGTSDFQIKDSIKFSLTKRFEFLKNAPTTASLYYEGRTGNPYSWVYSSDLNSDSRNDNDVVAVPEGSTDPRFDFSGMTAAQLGAYLDFIEESGLSKWAGGIAPRNSHTEPWVNRLDIRLAQELPIWGNIKSSLFLDFINFGAFLSESTFGYVETAPSLSNGVFRKRFLGGASYGTDGKIKPTYTSTPGDVNIDNGMSRWRIQVGAKFEF